MKIKKLRIYNDYKRFHDLTIDLGENPKRIIALVGPNGCGKSSVFDALMHRASIYGQIGRGSRKDFNYYSMTGDSKINMNSVEAELETGNIKQILEDQANEKKGNTLFSFRSPYRYNSDLKVKQTKATADIKLNNFGASNSVDLDAKMEENYRRIVAFYNRYMHDNDVKPSEAKDHIIGELNASLEKCLSLKICDLGSIDEGRGTLYFEKLDQPQPFEFNVLSSGEKEVVDIILDLFLRKDVYDNTIFLIDEPELHINTSIQKTLLLEINKLIGANCQIWVSTHSIGFLRALQTELDDECSIIEFTKDMEVAKQALTLTPMKMNFHNWRRLFATALDDITELVCPKQIIYCEGRDRPTTQGEERGFDAKVFNQVFGAQYPNTLFISSGGNTELDQRSSIAISILSKAVSGIEILVLKDRDVGSGKYMTCEDRQEYLETNDANHRMLVRVEIENYIFDKEVISAYCKEKDIEFDEVTYDQKISDIQNQDVKSLVNIMKNICGITGSINVDKFKLQLAKCIKPEMNIYSELENLIFKRS